MRGLPEADNEGQNPSRRINAASAGDARDADLPAGGVVCDAANRQNNLPSFLGRKTVEAHLFELGADE